VETVAQAVEILTWTGSLNLGGAVLLSSSFWAKMVSFDENDEKNDGFW